MNLSDIHFNYNWRFSLHVGNFIYDNKLKNYIGKVKSSHHKISYDEMNNQIIKYLRSEKLNSVLNEA